jgi:hypothetical protein
MIIKPMAFPNTNWKYLNCVSGFPTSPGTEIKVTPESAVPIMPKATKYHLEFLFALKKASFPVLFLLTKWEIRNKIPKYTVIRSTIAIGVISNIFIYK